MKLDGRCAHINLSVQKGEQSTGLTPLNQITKWVAAQCGHWESMGVVSFSFLLQLLSLLNETTTKCIW